MKGSLNATKINGYKSSFLIKDNLGNNVARFDDTGNVILKGTLEQNSNYQRTANDEWIIRNNEIDVFILDKVNGSLYIDGTLTENYQGEVTSPETANDFGIYGSDGKLVGLINKI